MIGGRRFRAHVGRAARGRVQLVATLCVAILCLAGGRDGVAGQEGAVGPDAARPSATATGEQAPSGEEMEALTRQVASQLRCVVCQGLSIEDSPSELAREMKDVVRDQLAAGRSPEEVKRYFVDTYGEWILLEPDPTGFNLAVYLLPVLTLGAGAVVVVVALRRWTGAAGEEAVAGPPGGAGGGE